MSERTPPSRPDLGSLAVAAYRTAFSRQPVAWGAWGALLVVTLGLDLVARRGGVSLDGSRIDAGFLTYSVIDSLWSALASGVALHAYLTGRGPARLGVGYFSFVGLITATELLWLCLFFFGMPRPPPDNPDPALAGRAALMLLILVLGGISCIRLLLWPIGRLLGRPPSTPRASWQAMRGMLGTYIGASILVALPFFMLVMVVGGAATAAGGHTLISTFLLRVVDVGMTAAATALSAEVWRRRVGDPKARLAEVFG